MKVWRIKKIAYNSECEVFEMRDFMQTLSTYKYGNQNILSIQTLLCYGVIKYTVLQYDKHYDTVMCRTVLQYDKHYDTIM